MKTSPRQLKKLYEQGENIVAYMRQEMGLQHNTREIIEVSYDIQTGSYIKILEDDKVIKCKTEYWSQVAKKIQSVCQPESILEAGIGEATTLVGVLKNMQGEINSYGFDLSWSRTAYAKNWLQKNDISNAQLCSGDLFNIPFRDNSMDVVFTSHAIEPNGGHEKTILKELYRVARKFLILIEPSYDLASDEAKQRMDAHGYCKNLQQHAADLGYEVLEHELFPYTLNKMNPSALTIIRKSDKDTDNSIHDSVFACPKYKTPLQEIDCALFSHEAQLVYPVIGDIPCLRIENGIFASKFAELASQD